MEFTVTDLACRRGELTVLSGVGFSVLPGNALVLRGPNGSGKTTLLRCLAGLTPPVAGRLSFESDQVAYAGHADALKTQMTVQETLSFWARVYGAAHTNAAIERFTLASLLTRRIDTLSAGQKRRVSLSRLVLSGRPLWALDEPTVSLDTNAVAQFASAVEAHLASGGAALIATHIDLGLRDAQVMDLTPFRADVDHTTLDPFLSEDAF
ncbi:MAG: heme ABC exporter ATP-binding protein CcmA [Litoreibacter sp.]|nr:heme ABC exporter ATP-binding protein CcmA [Litoreibacter sp.]